MNSDLNAFLNEFNAFLNALLEPFPYTKEEVNQHLSENEFVVITFTKKDGTETTKTFTARNVPEYEKKTDRVRPPRDPNYMSLWSVTDEGYRTLDVTKIKSLRVLVPLDVDTWGAS